MSTNNTFSVNFERRRSETLVFWFNELNCWRWPKIFGREEPRGVMNPKRTEIMNEIQYELGRRVLFQRHRIS
jgi:hypothetical protein